MISDFTSPEEIRAALGVDEVDIDDATILLPLYEKLLIIDLEDINIDLPATYASTMALDNPTAAESRLLSTAQVFATFSVAKTLAGSLPMFSLKQESDGKAQAQRFDNPYREAIKAVGNEYERARNKLMQALAALGSSSSTTTPRVYFSTVGLGTDPITNS